MEVRIFAQCCVVPRVLSVIFLHVFSFGVANDTETLIFSVKKIKIKKSKIKMIAPCSKTANGDGHFYIAFSRQWKLRQHYRRNEL